MEILFIGPIDRLFHLSFLSSESPKAKRELGICTTGDMASQNPFPFGSFQYFAIKSLRKLGHTVVPVVSESATTTTNIRKGSGHFENLHKMFKKFAPTESGKEEQVLSKIKQAFDKNNPHVAIVSANPGIKPASMQWLSKRIPTCLLYGASPFVYGNLNLWRSSRFYDVIFVNDTRHGTEFKILGGNAIYYPFIGCDPDTHRNTIFRYSGSAGNESVDVAFVGSPYLNRVKILSSLCDFNLGIWGPLELWKPWLYRHPKLRQFYKGEAGINEWINIYSSSIISLNLFGPDRSEPVNMRMFEIPACQGFQILPRHKRIESFFKPDEEVICFSGIQDLANSIRKYLREEEFRRNIAIRGQIRAYKDHNYEKRMSDILTILLEQRNKRHYCSG